MLLWLRINSFEAACFHFFLSYACFQLAWIAYSALRADVAPDHARAVVLGTIGSVAQLAGGIGLPLAGLLTRLFGPWAPFALAMILSFLLWPMTNALQARTRAAATAIPTIQV